METNDVTFLLLAQVICTGSFGCDRSFIPAIAIDLDVYRLPHTHA